MARLSSEEYSCQSVRLDIATLQMQQSQHSNHIHDLSFKQEDIASNHLYQTVSSSEEPVEYSFTFSTAPSAIDLTPFCPTTSGRFMLDFNQNIQMLPQSEAQPFHDSIADFDLFSNLVQPISSSTPFQFDPSMSASPFQTTSRVYDSNTFEMANFPLCATAPSTAPSTSPSSVTSSPSVSSSAVSSPVSTDFDESMTTLIPVIACASCKRSHIKCDSGRPCQNCLKHPSKALTCRDAVPKPRGRPKGGSKAAAEAIYQAKLQQQQQQLRNQQHGQFPRPRVMSHSHQRRPHLSMLHVQHPYQQQPQPQSRYLLSRSSPTSPAAAEHRAIRYARRPSLPAWLHHPYVVSNPNMSVPVSSSGLASELLYSMSPCIVSPTHHSGIDAHHVLQERLPIVGIPPHSSNSTRMGMGSCPPQQQMQQELHQLQMLHQNPCGQSPVMVKSEPKEAELIDLSSPISTNSAVADHDSGMFNLLQQQRREFHEQYQKQQVLYSQTKQQQHYHHHYHHQHQQQQQHQFC